VIAYDPSVIQGHAERLYRRASVLQLERACIWGLIGAALAYAATVGAQNNLGVFLGLSPLVAALSTMAVFGLLGYSSAREESLKLRLEAQLALCQVRIERNTAEAAKPMSA